jgi:hypothetical protein
MGFHAFVVDSIISTAYSDVIGIATPVLSWDAKTLFIGVGRPSDTGNIFVSDREKLKGKQ